MNTTSSKSEQLLMKVVNNSVIDAIVNIALFILLEALFCIHSPELIISYHINVL